MRLVILKSHTSPHISEESEKSNIIQIRYTINVIFITVVELSESKNITYAKVNVMASTVH